jgi:hypothetical protein
MFVAAAHPDAGPERRRIVRRVSYRNTTLHERGPRADEWQPGTHIVGRIAKRPAPVYFFVSVRRGPARRGSCAQRTRPRCTRLTIARSTTAPITAMIRPVIENSCTEPAQPN